MNQSGQRGAGCSRWKPGAVVIASILSGTVFVRLFLLLIPEVGGTALMGYHVHHLMVGILMMASGGIPGVLLEGTSRWYLPSVALMGLGLGLALDEWVLLVVRGAVPQTAYASQVSVLGAAVLVVLACVYAGIIQRLSGGFVDRRPRSLSR